MRYRLRILHEAKQSMRRMPQRVAQQAAEIILDLAEEPYPADSEPLGRELAGRFRIRVDGWRIIYLVDETDGLISILAIRQRDQRTYLNLP